MANIPTEEIFSSPHWAKTEGRLQVTRPVHVLNGVVEGAFFEFKNGRVENYGAKSGQEQLDNFFAIDERARFAGEIALVDVSSPIFQCGKMLHSILFDENAACHLALGAAYPLGYEHSEISSESLQELGFNQSILHTDFMFGSNELKILAKDKGGQEHLVMDQGRFQF